LSRLSKEDQDGPFAPDRYSGRALWLSGAGGLGVVVAYTMTAAAVEPTCAMGAGAVGAGTCSVEPLMRGEGRTLTEAYAAEAGA